MKPLNRVLSTQHRVLILCFIMFAVTIAGSALAKEAQTMAEDPVLEKRVNEISAELRCLVCQNQTIADSNAGLAVDLKNQVRDMVRDNKSEQDIIDYMVTRYGDFILYRPPVKPTTYVLWAGPFVLMVVALFFLMRNLRKRRELIVDTPFSDNESGKLSSILNRKSEDAAVLASTKTTAPSADEGKET